MTLEQTKENVIEILCNSFEVDRDQMFSISRRRNIADARSMLAYWLRKNTTLSLSAIGQQVRYLFMDHTTVIHAIKRTSDLIETEPTLRNIYSKLPKYIEVPVHESYPLITSMRYSPLKSGRLSQ